MPRYRTIVADPPWPIGPWRTSGFRTKGDGSGKKWRAHKQELGYDTMTVDDIAALPISSLAEDDAHLYLWTTDAFLLDGSACLIAGAWGFKPQRCLVWMKPSMGMGRGWRPNHEIVIACKRGALAFADVSLPTAFRMKQQYVKTGNSVAKLHSGKPEGFLDYVEQASPAPRLEMFARRARFGWDYWGDESLGTAEMTA